MGSITKRKRVKGIVYRAEVCIKGNPRLTATFDRRSEALRWIEDTESALRAGGYVGNAPPGDMLFDDALDRYMDEVSAKKARSTHEREHRQAAALLRYLKSRKLSEITTADVANYRDSRSSEVGASTVRKDMALLSHLYTIARTEWNLDVSNPVAKVRRPSPPPGRLRFLKREEISALLEEAGKSRRKWLREYIILQINTGMRPSEGAGIRWKQVDLDGRIITLDHTKTRPRRVPLTIQAVESLAAIMPAKSCSPGDYVFMGKNPKMTYRRQPGQYYRESFDAAVKRAGINDFHLHDLRHTAASHMVMSGLDIRTIADILGHSTLAMTMRYTHLLDQHKIKAVDSLSL
jgi:integrase